jgi:hypothetical protein
MIPKTRIPTTNHSGSLPEFSGLILSGSTERLQAAR